MEFKFGKRRNEYIDITEAMKKSGAPLSTDELQQFETYDLIYRTLCATLYNYVPLSGHPGGSISSGRFVSALLFNSMDYDLSDPERKDADIISYAAGHKALGLYAMWALRNEIARIGANNLLPANEKSQLRLEDLLGFRRNPVTATPLFKKFNARALDGHPTPQVPFVRLSTGASGVGVTTSLGLAYSAMDFYPDDAPKVHIIEGEAGMTPGRVAEAFAAASAASLKNAIIHIDWNQASIDSNNVCRDGETPGDYVQWSPAEFAYLHDWNVIYVHDGTDFQQIIAAHRAAAEIKNSQPTAIVYRTTKGWKYGIEGAKSHGAGHPLCSEGFHQTIQPLLDETGGTYPSCRADAQRCMGGKMSEVVEQCFWEALTVIRSAMEQKKEMVNVLAQRLTGAKQRLDRKNRSPRANAPSIDKIYEIAKNGAQKIPEDLVLKPGTGSTLRAELGRTLNYYNKASNGAIFAAAADLLGSTSVKVVGGGFADGFYNTATNPESRILSIGGICEDAQSGIMAGISTMGQHIGVCSSYGAFIAALGHIASRLHGIGNEAKKMVTGEAYKPFILVCAHAGIKTGEDGPTHADPQPLQLLQENFPQGIGMTLTPWDPQELWILVSAALAQRPAIIFPFVTRPTETIVDRKALGLAPAEAAAKGVYPLYQANGNSRGTLILQGSEVANEFVATTLPMLKEKGIEIDAYYVASAELFNALPKEEQQQIFPQEKAKIAMGITGFTPATMYRWVTSERGREAMLSPFKKGHFLGSGKAEMVIKEAGLDGANQYKAIVDYLEKL